MGKVLVLGASENTSRYSNIVIHRLLQNGHDVLAVGRTEGIIEHGFQIPPSSRSRIPAVDIHSGKPELEDIDTITLYLNPKV